MTADGIRRHSEGNVKRHPERTWRICTRCVIVPLPCFLIQHSYPRSEWHQTARRHNEGNIKRHSEHQRRICCRGEGNGKSLVGSYERNRVITPHHIDAFMFYRQRTCCKYNWEVPLNGGIFLLHCRDKNGKKWECRKSISKKFQIIFPVSANLNSKGIL